MQLLADAAMTNIRIHGIGGNVISNHPTITANFVSGLEVPTIGPSEQFFNFIYVSVSSAGYDLFDMHVRTGSGEYLITERGVFIWHLFSGRPMAAFGSDAERKLRVRMTELGHYRP